MPTGKLSPRTIDAHEVMHCSHILVGKQEWSSLATTDGDIVLRMDLPLPAAEDLADIKVMFNTNQPQLL